MKADLKAWVAMVPILRERRYRVGAEVGAQSGHNAKKLLRKTVVRRLYCVDAWVPTCDFPRDICERHERQFDAVAAAFPKRLVKVRALSVDAAGLVPDALDFVLIDADHAYESVLADIDAWRGKVRPGGAMFFHDYGHWRYGDVSRAVHERFDAGEVYAGRNYTARVDL